MRTSLIAAGLAVFTLGATPAPAPTRGYLEGAAAPDTLRILPPAPVAGSARYEADRLTYLATRSLKDTPRWALAASDVDETVILRDMACAVGVELTPQNAPRTTALMARMRMDVRLAVNRTKDVYKRQRPYQIDPGPTCQEQTAGLTASPDYPSGHNTWGWSVALVLAELAPDRASDILVRGRAYGESRLVCGVHNLSAVEGGRTNGSIVVAALHGSPAFRKDLDTARAEVAAARKAGPAPDPAACAAEATLTATSPY
jgi:acid phosphatase (class A)